VAQSYARRLGHIGYSSPPWRAPPGEVVITLSILSRTDARDQAGNGDYLPVAVRLVDLDAPVYDLRTQRTAAGVTYSRALLLVRLHGEPLGAVTIELHEGSARRDDIVAAILLDLEDRILEHGARYACLQARSVAPEALHAGLPAGAAGCPGSRLNHGASPEVDVIVPTAGRPSRVRPCLESLQRLDYPRFRIVVVDNRPEDGATREVVAALRRTDGRIHYFAEPRPGSSVARNRGIAESSADILAFTDDDVCVDPQWLSWLVHGFQSDPSVTVVTGLVMPTDMDTPAQRSFEEHVGFGKGFARRTFDLREHRAAEVPLFPYWGATFGSGNNMAFRRAQLLLLGGFDPALGAGSLALAGADIESFTHAILKGGRLVYEPRALCWHDHRSDESALQRQLFCYWVGFTAILTKWAIRTPWGLAAALIRALPAAAGVRRGAGRTVPREVERFRDQLRMSARRSTLGLQFKGYVLGPAMYVRSSLWARRLRLHDVLAARPARLLDADSPPSLSRVQGPVAIRMIDLDAPVEDISVDGSATNEPYRSLEVVVRLGGRPLGSVMLPLALDQRVTAAALADAIRKQLGRELRDALAARGEQLPAALPLDGFERRADQGRTQAQPAVTVVVPTCRNPVRLERCLRSILATDYERVDVVVVENRPGSPVTRDLLTTRFPGDERIRYVEEARRGAASARNRGLAHASGEIVAFVDDDVVVDPAWLRMATAAFLSSDEVGCVTGLILPLALDTHTQVLREQLSTFGKGFRPTRFSLPETRRVNPLFPFTPGHVGSGANTLLRASLARRLGGFDPRLGPATPTMGGGELDLYIRVLYSGADILYEPGVIVWHEHPDEPRSLTRYAFRFGVGLGAVLAKQFIGGPERLRLLSLAPAGVRYALNPNSRKNVTKSPYYPRRLDVVEGAGMLVGPAAWLASVAAAKNPMRSRPTSGPSAGQPQNESIAGVPVS
jgi:GT2 family glycosyltransferase